MPRKRPRVARSCSTSASRPTGSRATFTARVLVEPELVDMEFDSLAKDKQVIVVARDPELGAASR